MRKHQELGKGQGREMGWEGDGVFPKFLVSYILSVLMFLQSNYSIVMQGRYLEASKSVFELHP